MAPALSTPRSSRVLGLAAVAASLAYVAVTIAMARHVTFYWDDYYLLLTLQDRGLGGALITGLNGNWWPLATLGLWVETVLFGSWYPAYLAVNTLLVVGTAWAGWFALAPVARRRPWLLAAAMTVYAGSLGMVVNITVMTISWPLAAFLAMTAAALAVRRRPPWLWGTVLALAFLAESGLFAVLATTVAAVILVVRAGERGWTRPPARDLVLGASLVVLGLLGTAVGYVIATRDPIDYYVSTGVGDGSSLGIDLMATVRSAVAFVPAWVATPLLPPMLVLPKALPWLVVLIDARFVLASAAVLVAVVVVALLWIRRAGDVDARERWGRLAAAAVLVVPVIETAFVLSVVRGGSGLAPRYAICWLLPIAAAWAVLLQCPPPSRWLRVLSWIPVALLAASAISVLVALPWTFRAAFDIDKQRWDHSANQVEQMQRCRDGLPAVADQQVSPGLRDELLCQFVGFVDRR